MGSEIDTADIVRHGPTGEEWVVGYVRGDRLAWLGWPEGEALLSDCTLVEKASPQDRLTTLRLMAKSQSHTRSSYALQALAIEATKDQT